MVDLFARPQGGAGVQKGKGKVSHVVFVGQDVMSCAEHDDVAAVVAQPQQPVRNWITSLNPADRKNAEGVFRRVWTL